MLKNFSSLDLTFVKKNQQQKISSLDPPFGTSRRLPLPPPKKKKLSAPTGNKVI